MGRKKQYHKVRLENVIHKIALWELCGQEDMAMGLREFFHTVISKEAIDRMKDELIFANPDLKPKGYETEKLIETWAKTNEPGNGKRKTGVFREIRTIKNRSGNGSKTYQWAYDVTYQDGKRIESKSIGRVSD